MKTTIKAVDEKVRSAAEAAAQLEEEANRASIETKDLQEQATAAAEAGDLERYRALKKQILELEEASFVRRSQLKKKTEGVTPEEVLTAWDGYVGDFNKKMASRLADLEQKKKALLDAYSAAVELQAEGLEIRERLAGYIKADPQGFAMDVIPSTNPVMRMPSNDALCAFYLTETWDRSTANPWLDAKTQRVATIVNHHKLT